MCAFDVLATLADTLLQEKENTTMYNDTSSEKDQHGFVKMCQDANKSFKVELPDEGSYDKKCFSVLSSQRNNQHCSLNEFPHLQVGFSGIASTVTSSSYSERFVGEKLVDGKSHNEMENNTHKVKLDFSGYPEDSRFKLDGELHKFEKVPIGNGTEMCSLEDLLDENPPALISLGGNAKFSGCNDGISCSPLSKGCDNVPVVSRDDDENSSGCTRPSTKTESFRPKTCISDNRIGNILDSEFQKVAEKSKDDILSNSDPGISSSEACQHQTLRCRSSHVKLRIKSFRVPELFIEVPETATIGSLKRTVMDSVTTVLGGGLRIGVILQGKKVRDGSKTLLQTGISQDNQLDALGFTLEPNSSQSLPIECAAHSPHFPSADIPQPPISPAVIHQQVQGNSDMLPEHQITSLGNLVESGHDSAPSTINASLENGETDSKRLVIVPEMDKEELAMLTVHQKSKRSDIVQRRIRRPFSVDEVEALIQAVEKVGTGRWRDIKLLAFGNAKHRTYVDLKDKWKTLVHTARISPQQRRGEPVPQELLDRVLTAPLILVPAAAE